MKNKSIIRTAIVACFLTSGIPAYASPDKAAILKVQPEVKLLSAKIENALAELPDNKSIEAVQTSTNFVLNNEEAEKLVMVAALEMVVYNAKAVGDQTVVTALTEFKWEINIAEDIVQAVSVQPVTKPSFAPPPDVGRSGRSDY